MGWSQPIRLVGGSRRGHYVESFEQDQRHFETPGIELLGQLLAGDAVLKILVRNMLKSSLSIGVPRRLIAYTGWRTGSSMWLMRLRKGGAGIGRPGLATGDIGMNY